MTATPRRDQKAGTWWFVVELPMAGDGRRRQARRRGFATKAAAQAALDEVRMSVRRGSYVPPARQHLADFLADEWLPAIESTVELSTWASYERNMRLHVIPRIGAVPLDAVDEVMLNRFYAELLAHGRLDGRPGGLSPRTVRYIHTILGRALADAVRSRRLLRNPASTASPPGAAQAKTKAPEMLTWSAETLAAFLAAEDGTRYHPAFLFLATTGCRRGEALGVRWKDIDFERSRASLRQTIGAIDHQVHVKSSLKSHRARVIDLDPETVATLRAWRRRQSEERLAHGPEYHDGDLVFCHPDGRPFHPERFSREFERRRTRHGAPKIRLHDLRHTWATLALQAGVDVKIVSERLGHSSATITWDIYQHVTPAMQSDAAARVAQLIFRPAGA